MSSSSRTKKIESTTLSAFTNSAVSSAVWSVVNTINLSDAGRIDPEYYQPRFIKFDRSAESYGQALPKIFPKIIQPTEFTRMYVDEENGAIFLRAQNVTRGYVDTEEVEYIDWSIYEEIADSHIEEGDLLITRTGANAGDCAVVPYYIKDTAVSSHTLRLVPEDVELGYAIGAFFASDFGHDILLRSISGSSRPQITKSALSSITLPDFTPCKAQIREIYKDFYAAKFESEKLIKQAEIHLLEEFGFDNFDFADTLTYQANLSDFINSERLDAEYFQPSGREFFNKLDQFSTFQIHEWGDVSSGYPWRSSNFLSKFDKGEPFIRIRDCKPGSIFINDLSRLESDYAHNEGVEKASTGNLVVGMDGVNYFYASIVLERCYVNQRVSHISPYEDSNIPSEYIMLVINSKIGQLQLLRKMTIAQTVGHITNQNIKNLVIPLLAESKIKDISNCVLKSISKRKDAVRLLELAMTIASDFVTNQG